MKIPGMDLVGNWEDNLTWDDILEMEAQGSDMKEIKERFLAKQKEEEEKNKYSNILRFTMDKVETKYISNKTSISKLDSVINDCRNPESQIVRDTIGRPPFFGLIGKPKWIENIKSSDVLYTSVVQCHPQLWEKVTGDITPAAYLLVYSLNPEYMRNIEVLKKVSKLLNDFRDMENIDNTKYSAPMQKLYNDLDNPDSTPHVVLDATLLSEIGIDESDADIRVTSSFIYDHTPLPNKKLPSDGILPFIRYKEKKLSTDTPFAYATRLIPSKYYK